MKIRHTLLLERAFTGVVAALLVFLFTTSCDSGGNRNDGSGLQGDISISGAFALYPLAVKWAEEFQKIHPGVRIDISAGGAGKGMADALFGQADLGMVSRDINEEEIKKGAWWLPVTKDAVVPTINAKNPYMGEIFKRGITKKTFSELWSGQSLTWGEIAGQSPKDPVKVYTRSDASGAGESWAKYLSKKQDDLKGVGVFGDPGLAQAVKNDIFGIGFNNVIYAYDLQTKKPYAGISVIPIDINENGILDANENFYASMEDLNKAIADGIFPSPPARELYFVSKGKPSDPVVIEFLKWIVNDGQKYVKETGFIQLSEDKIIEANNKLK